MRINELNVPVQPDTYEASMFLKQSIRAGKYAIKIHNLLSNDQEMESWVAKKIDLASGYIASVAHYLEGQTYSEDAGEGHMSKSQLYATAKYALQIASIVRPGDDIEGWVQTKMNQAVDMLDAVYHYEDYQMLNPYREEIGDLHGKHAEIVKKNIDEILATETPVDDIETKPGMLNILKKRVHQFEKDYAKENRKTDEAGSRMPSSMIKIKAKLDSMSPEEIRAYFKNKEDFAKQHAAGVIRPGFSAKELAQGQEFRYGREFAKRNPYSKHFESTELDEGLKDWLQRIAAAGIIVGSVAGIGSINNAMDNSVPVIQAMNKALDVANQKNDQQMIKNIKQDIETAKISLNSGQSLNTVKNMQDRYAKFMPTEYKKENKSFKDRIMGKIMSPIKDYNKQNNRPKDTEQDKMDTKQPANPNDPVNEEKKGLYYYVNKRKKAGTSRSANNTKAPTAQAWKDAAKTAKKENAQPDVSEEKQKGVDGKACWKGYRRMGTKMKDGKRVDNCVKYESKLAEKLANKLK
ncbi:hypothetical protein EB001_17595 [bacterium]|nr:hypothetical protein [bacterium]